MRHARGLFTALLLVVTVLAGVLPGAAAPEGQLTWAVHVSLAPTLFDAAETTGIITPFLFLYALHDALVKPMPGTLMAPGLAGSWSVSPDGLVYEFVLRRGTKFHFAEQWDPKSPWHDRRVRLAANHGIDRQAINQAETLGFSKIIGSIIPSHFESYWQPPLHAYDPARARRLLAEAGYPHGFDAGDYTCDAAFASIAEAMINDLKGVGIQARLRPLERAAFFRGYSEKKHRGLVQAASAAFGNAATRLEAFVAGSGAYAYGSYPDIDGLFREQGTELDGKRRAAALERIQQLVHDKAMWRKPASASSPPTPSLPPTRT